MQWCSWAALFSILNLDLCGWTSGYANLGKGFPMPRKKNKKNFLIIPQIRLQRSFWCEVLWTLALTQGRRWLYSLSLWCSLLFLWWPLTKSRCQLLKEKQCSFLGSFNVSDQNTLEHLLKDICPQHQLSFLSLFLEICWEEKIASTAPKTTHVWPTIMLPIQMEQICSLPFLQLSYLHTDDLLGAFSLGIFHDTVRQIHDQAWLFQFLCSPW